MKMYFKVPTKWDELSNWQLRTIGRFMFNNHNEQIQSKFLKCFCAVVLLLNHSPVRILKVAILLCSIPLVRLAYLADFIVEKESRMTRFPNRITVGRWPFRKRLYGPSRRLGNVTIQELSFADKYYYDWVTKNEIVDLMRLTAILYRPPAKKPHLDDVREPFSNLALERNAMLTDRVPHHMMYMVAHAYEGCRTILIDAHPKVFPKVKSDDDGGKSKVKPYQSFARIIDSMAMDEVQIFGSHQRAEQVNAWKFMNVFQESIVRQEKQERQYQLNAHKGRR